MANKTTNTTRDEQYRAILEKEGIREYKVLAFVFETESGPEYFHYQLMYPLRPVYHLFDCSGKMAYVVVPVDPENERMCIQLAESCGGEKTTPNMR